MQLHELIHGRRYNSATQLFGLEVELENVAPYGDVVGWVASNDGSLRNGVEFVLDGPKSLAQSRTCIGRLGPIIESATDSVRCSFHVHVDTRAWSIDELSNVLRTYMTFEHVFFELSGNREGSQFCTPVVRSGIETTVRNIIRGPTLHNIAVRFDSVKYAALNVGHLQGIGSLEFRHHKGLTSSSEGIAWLNIVANFCNIAKGITRNQLRAIAMCASPSVTQDFQDSLFLTHVENNPFTTLMNFKATEIG